MTLRTKRSFKGRAARKRSSLASFLALVLTAVLISAYGFLCLILLTLRWVNPPFTAVQVERRIASWTTGKPYTKRYVFVKLPQISPELQHAVIAAEDTRFFQHHGFDWEEIGNAVEQDLEEHRERGASTITQQLARNLFLSTNRSIIRKGLEFTIVPFIEWTLSKRRILELYLNVIEWGPGVYGAEAASRYYFHISALRLTREDALELASILPSPLHRKPGSMRVYESRISSRMRQLGW